MNMAQGEVLYFTVLSNEVHTVSRLTNERIGTTSVSHNVVETDPIILLARLCGFLSPLAYYSHAS
jgi:hypothetical protein